MPSAAVSTNAAEDARNPLLEALARTEHPAYADVLNGIRETAAAVEHALARASMPEGAIADELAALEAHERRLRGLGAPDLRAEAAHDALLSELRLFRDDPLAPRRLAALAVELARYA